MKNRAFALLSLLFVLQAMGQETVYNFLRLPVSAHVAALGGDNITLAEDDGTMVFHNPALINYVTDKTLNLNVMTYMQGTVTGSASFTRAVGKRGTWAVNARYMDYGSMKETSVDGTITGDFSARDIAVGGSYAYALTNHITGGITAKMVASYIGQFSSWGAAVDLGLNYFNEEHGWSFSAVARNLGGQLSAYEDDFEPIPLDVQVGISKRLMGSPLRFSATMARLNDWSQGFGHHLVLGADLLLGSQFYVAAGYNFMRVKDMKISNGEGESSHGAALSFGAGMSLERFKIHVAYAKYHVSCTSLLFNFSYTL